jgi:N-acetylmuramoyl-L-alanine amidase
MNIVKRPAKSHGGRFALPPSLVVLHWTAGSTTQSALDSWDQMAAVGKKVSAHYVIDREGGTVEAVSPDLIAYHAGVSEFNGHVNCNDFAIGIELVNWGPLTQRAGSTKTFFNWVGGQVPASQVATVNGAYFHAYTDKQTQSLIALLLDLSTRYPSLKHLTGHKNISKTGKQDPGPLIDLGRLETLLRGRE